MYILAPSILAADFGNLRKEIETVSEAGAQYIHIDVMDGMFVPSISFGMPVIQSVRSCTDKVFDVHMMVEEPGRYVEDMKSCGADIITVHAEACTHLDRVVNQIKDLGLKAGVALNPATPIQALDCILDQLDMVLIMTVEPGFGGQGFIPECMDKIKAVRAEIQKHGYNCELEIDGGAKLTNTADIVAAGADVIVAGSAVFGGDIADNVKKFHEVFEEGAARATWTK